MKKIFLFIICLFIHVELFADISKPKIDFIGNIKINSYTGGLFYQRKDFTIKNSTIIIDILFTYNSTNRNIDRGYGNGWSLYFDYRYTKNGSNINVYYGDGNQEEFSFIGNKYTSSAGNYDNLAEYELGKFVLKTDDGLEYYFDNSYHKKLTRIKNLKGAELTIYYKDTLISQIKNSLGQYITFNWDNGHIVKISDGTNKSAIYEYDSKGNLEKVKYGNDEILKYNYGQNNELVRITDELDDKINICYNNSYAIGKIFIDNYSMNFSYSFLDHRETVLMELFDNKRIITKYIFDKKGCLVKKIGEYGIEYKYDANNNKIEEVDKNGNKRNFIYDGNGNMIKEIDSYGNFREYEYNNNLKIWEKDKNGNIKYYEYDSKNYLTKITYPQNITEEFLYDSKGNKTQYKDKNGNITLYEYDEFGNITKIINPLNQAELFEYDSNGNRISYTNENNQTTIYTYDYVGNVLTITDPLGNITSYTYDYRGNKISEKYPEGNIFTYSYNIRNKIKQIKDPMGNISNFDYDGRGNLIKETDANGNSTYYKYNDNNNLVEKIDPEGAQYIYEYDKNGNVIKIIDGLGNILTYEYDFLNRRIKETNALGYFKTWQYDSNGNVLVSTDYKGTKFNYSYDAFNRVVKVTNHYGINIQYEYDNVGNITNIVNERGYPKVNIYDKCNRLIEEINTLGKKKKIIYDPAGNIIEEINFRGFSTKYIYDENNRQISIIDNLNNTISYIYDNNGRVIFEIDKLGNTNSYKYNLANNTIYFKNKVGEEFTYDYDNVGNLIRLNFPAGVEINYSYNKNNKLVKISDELGIIQLIEYDKNSNVIKEVKQGFSSSYEIDALNRVVCVIDPDDNKLHFKYDENSNIIEKRDRTNNLNILSYDLLNRKITETDNLGIITKYSYDDAGNNVNIIDANNNITSFEFNSENVKIKETYADNSYNEFLYDENGNLKSIIYNSKYAINCEYDQLDRLVEKNYTNGLIEKYQYDKQDNILRATTNNSEVLREYDGLNRIIKETINGKRVVINYNKTNYTKSIIYPGGREVVKTFDKRGNVCTISDQEGQIVHINFNDINLPVSKLFKNGIVANYTYNQLGRISSISYSSEMMADAEYSYNSEGLLINENNLVNPSFSYLYSYDPKGRVVKSSRKDNNYIKEFTYDNLSNKTQTILNGVQTSFNSNELNQFNSSQNINFKYDELGNMVYDGMHTYKYNLGNLITEVDDGYTAKFSYDAFGRRIEKITMLDTIKYFYDDNVIIEEQKQGLTYATYIYGNSWIDDVISMDKNSHTYFYHKNSNESVIAITNESGIVVERYDYSPYGLAFFYDGDYNSISKSEIDNSILFSSSRYDSETGLYFFRSRYYSPILEVFNSKDKLGYIDGMNLYEFFGSSPINYMDPMGTYKERRSVSVSLSQGIGVIGDIISNISEISIKLNDVLKYLPGISPKFKWDKPKGDIIIKGTYSVDTEYDVLCDVDVSIIASCSGGFTMSAGKKIFGIGFEFGFKAQASVNLQGTLKYIYPGEKDFSGKGFGRIKGEGFSVISLFVLRGYLGAGLQGNIDVTISKDGFAEFKGSYDAFVNFKLERWFGKWKPIVSFEDKISSPKTDLGQIDILSIIEDVIGYGM